MLTTDATASATREHALVGRPERGDGPARRSRRAARAAPAATRAAARSARRRSPRRATVSSATPNPRSSAAGPSSVAKPHQTKTASVHISSTNRNAALAAFTARTIGRAARLGRMSLYDAFRELPLHIEEVVTDVHVLPGVATEFTRKTTVVHLRPEPYFRHIGPEGLGEDVTYDPDEHEPHRWPWVDLLGDWTLESFSARLDDARPLPRRRAAAARLPRLPPLGVRVGRARPGAQAGAALDRRGARPRVPRRHLRLLDARDRRSTTGSRSTPTCASSSTRRPSGRTR